MFRHWNAGRSQVQINEALNIDRKTIRKYLAPALAEGLAPCPEEFDEELWRARIGRWFPELVDPAARALSWPQIAAHHQWISDQLKVPVTVATIAQRLRDDHHVEVSESTVRRYIATTFADDRLEEKVTVPRGAVEPGSEAQIDYGKLGMWLDPVSGRRVAVWAFVMVLSHSRHRSCRHRPSNCQGPAWRRHRRGTRRRGSSQIPQREALRKGAQPLLGGFGFSAAARTIIP